MKNKAQQKAVIYAMPKSYIERQRIINALQLQGHELVMWHYGESTDGNKFLWGVYLLKEDYTFSMYIYDPETLQKLGRGWASGSDGKRATPNINNIYNWLHKKEGGFTNLLGYAIGVQHRPPTLEGKIIQFPVQSISNKKATA